MFCPCVQSQGTSYQKEKSNQVRLLIMGPSTSIGYLTNYVCYPVLEHERGKVIGVGVLICLYICLWTNKKIESYLVIDSLFQTFALGLLFEFID